MEVQNLKFGPFLSLKSSKSQEKSLITTFKSISKVSFVNRPIQHVGSICLCYSNSKDCTTCNQSSTTFSESKSDVCRMSAGLSPLSSSSSDGSSLFENPEKSLTSIFNCAESSNSDFSYSTDGSSLFNDVDNQNQYQMLNQCLHDLRSELLLKISEFRELYRTSTHAFRELLWYEKFREDEIPSQMEWLKSRVEAEKNEVYSKMDQALEIKNDIELNELLLQECNKEYNIVRNKILYRMIDEDLIKSNYERVKEINDKFPKYEDKLSNMELRTLDALDRELSSLLTKLGKQKILT